MPGVLLLSLACLGSAAACLAQFKPAPRQDPPSNPLQVVHSPVPPSPGAFSSFQLLCHHGGQPSLPHHRHRAAGPAECRQTTRLQRARLPGWRTHHLQGPSVHLRPLRARGRACSGQEVSNSEPPEHACGCHEVATMPQPASHLVLPLVTHCSIHQSVPSSAGTPSPPT